MPNWWNLELDWPIADSIDERHNLLTLFVSPIVEISNCRIESVNGIKKLVIDVETSDPIDIFAIVHGLVDSSGVSDKYELTTDIFNTLWPYEIFRREECREVPVSWFYNWLLAETIPNKIIYENIINVNPTPCMVRAGVKIGEMGNHPTDDSKKQIKISIGYAGSNPRFMHPREFFSLLFWREECDPFYTDTPIDYDRPLLKKMMRLYDDGSSVINERSEPVDDIGDVLDNVFHCDENIDSWLGLRPPLRTYKRVEWEARVTHVVHHDNWQTAGSLRGVLRNPLIVGTAARASKCNIFAGEMAFRAGFRVFVHRASGTRLQYDNCSTLASKHCIDPSCNENEIFPTRRGGVSSRLPRITHNGDTYQISLPYGIKRYVSATNSDFINGNISTGGRVIIHSRRGYTDPIGAVMGHVVILAHLDRVLSNNIRGTILDQHCTRVDIPKACNYRRPCGGCDGPTGRAFIELIPGGDPTEEWGVIDLNCLEEVP
ncbi:MAG: hypothetical protein KAV25_06740 [Methanophagales archaeon]|nr:hypothetical protein [Methanophagales archaeon]